MSDHLKAHIEKFVKISEQDYFMILTYFKPVHTLKKSNLLVEGKVCKSSYFVVSGCLRMFFINEKGVEQTIQFALKNWWLADYTSFSAQKPSEFYIQAVENSDLLALDFFAQEEMLQQFPVMERYFRLVHFTKGLMPLLNIGSNSCMDIPGKSFIISSINVIRNLYNGYLSTCSLHF